MSLSDQLNRVDGSQNIILKAIAKAFGISIGAEKIDQVASLVSASPKFGQDALISAVTASSLGLSATATPNEAFSKLKSLVDVAQSTGNQKTRMVIGTYVGDGSTNWREFNIGFKPSLFILNQSGIAGYIYGVNVMIGTIITSVQENKLQTFELTNSGFKVRTLYVGQGEVFNNSGYVYGYAAFV